jgi:nucleoside-diphosphate-sugar epimerase
MRVAITGASGFVGGAIVRGVTARGDTWNGLTRRANAPLAGPGGTWIPGELADLPSLERLVRDADAIVHAAAWVHRDTPDPASRDACFAVNLRGTERVLEAVRKRGVPLVFVSSTSVYGESFEDRDEGGPHQPQNAYGESKRQAELAVLEFGRAARSPVVVLRPAMVYGAGAPGNIARLAGFVRRGFAPLVAGGRNRKSLVHADDLTAAVLAALDRARDVNGGVFNVASEPAPSMREVGDALAAGLGRSVTWVPVPRVAWNAGAALGHFFSGGGRRPDLGRTMEVYASSTTVRARAIVEKLGVRFRDVHEGLMESVRGTTSGAPSP